MTCYTCFPLKIAQGCLLLFRDSLVVGMDAGLILDQTGLSAFSWPLGTFWSFQVLILENRPSLSFFLCLSAHLHSANSCYVHGLPKLQQHCGALWGWPQCPQGWICSLLDPTCLPDASSHVRLLGRKLHWYSQLSDWPWGFLNPILSLWSLVMQLEYRWKFYRALLR